VLDELLSRIRNDDGFDGMMTMPWNQNGSSVTNWRQRLN